VKICNILIFLRFFTKVRTFFNVTGGVQLNFSASRQRSQLTSLFKAVAGLATGLVLIVSSGFAIADPSSPSDSQSASNYYFCSGSGGAGGQFGSETSMAALCILAGSTSVEIVGTPACSGWNGPYAPGDDEAYCSATVRFWVPFYGGVPAHWEYRTWGGSVSRCSMNPTYTKWNGSSCVRVVPKKTDGGGCEKPLGDPIFPATGTTKQTIVLPFSVGGTGLEIVYDQRQWVPVQQNLAVRSQAKPVAFGSLWQLNLFKSLVPYKLTSIPGGVSALELQQGGNRWRNYQPNATGTSFTSVDDLLDVIKPQAQGWLRVDGANGNEELYDSSGNLTFIYSSRGGFISNIVQSGGFELTDHFGRVVQFAAGSNGLIQTITGPDGYITQISYDGINNLKQVTWFDTGSFVQLNYADSHVWALTGVVDENHSQLGDGIQFASFDYDIDGRAIGT